MRIWIDNTGLHATGISLEKAGRSESYLYDQKKSFNNSNFYIKE